MFLISVAKNILKHCYRKKCQRCPVVNLENNFWISTKFTNNYFRISGKMGFMIEEKVFL
jgi:hypothetical protein